MNKMWKCMLSLLLVMVTVCGVLSPCVNASTVSGTCGDAWWSLDISSGELTIHGSGRVYNNTWDSHRSLIKTVSMGDGITSIGSATFQECENLTHISIPDCVTDIGSCAFKGCTSLTSVSLPDKLKKIEGSLFYECIRLTEITIPEGVTVIKANAFHNCSTLASVTIPSNVTEIGDYAFDGCAGLANVVIPDRVTAIHVSTFSNCKNLTSIVIPDSVTSIDSWAFGGCEKLASITIPNSVTNMGYGVFSQCTNLKNVKLPEKLSVIKKNFFSDCTRLTNVIIPESVTIIEGFAFQNCSILDHVTIPNSVTSIGASAFGGCEKLASIIIPNSITNMDWGIFRECASLTSVIIPETVTTIDFRYFFQGCTSLTTVTLPSSVTSIGDYAFGYCNNLTCITIPETVTTIEQNAFRECKKLVSVNIPNSVTHLGVACFYNCSALTCVSIGNNLSQIERGAFYGTKLTDVFYMGSEAQWQAVSIESSNQPILNANIHYGVAEIEENEPFFQRIFTPKAPAPSGSTIKIIEIPYYCSYLTDPHATVEWSDELFNNPSTKYEKRIDMLGAALSAAAEGKDGSDGSKIADAYIRLGCSKSDISLYSYSGSKEYNEFNAKNEEGEEFAKDDNLAFSIACKKLTGKNCADTNLIIITARGTTTIQEGIMDAIQGESGKVLGYKTYDWYTDFCKDILAGLKHYIGQHGDLKNTNVKILITGHSLGGAAANLVVAVLTQNAGAFDLKYQKEDVFGYTYGAVSPLVEQTENVLSGYENIYNTFNELDTFGPNGTGLPTAIDIPGTFLGTGSKPKGSDNIRKKFGKMRIFCCNNKAYHDAAKKWNGLSTANHDMPGYIYAVACDLVYGKRHAAVNCPVDVEIRSGGEIVGRIINNVIDESITKIPCAVIGEAKQFALDQDNAYEIILTGTDSGSMAVTYSSTASDGETKTFVNIVLYRGKTMTTQIAENEEIGDYTLHVINASDEAVAEIKQDGSEDVKLSSPVVFRADVSATVCYLSQVTVTARAVGVPNGYFVALFDGQTEIARGDNVSVTKMLDSCLKTDRTLTAKVIDAGGAVQKDADGKVLQAEARITVKKDFFSKLFGWLKSLFGIHSKMTIEL